MAWPLSDEPRRLTEIPVAPASNVTTFRVRYSETDQMGGFYNSRALEWFELGRTEVLRRLVPYAEMERRGVLLPVVEAHVKYLRRARYDDELRITSRVELFGRARLRFEHVIEAADGGDSVVRGHTIHAITDATGRPVRPPAWLVEALPDVP